jgi:hypothetical protein
MSASFTLRPAHPIALAVAGLLMACNPGDPFSTGPRPPAGTPPLLTGVISRHGLPAEGVALRLVPDPPPEPLDDQATERLDAALEATAGDGTFIHALRQGGGGITLQVTRVPEGCAAPAAQRFVLQDKEVRHVELVLACPRGPKPLPPD